MLQHVTTISIVCDNQPGQGPGCHKTLFSAKTIILGMDNINTLKETFYYKEENKKNQPRVTTTPGLPHKCNICVRFIGL